MTETLLFVLTATRRLPQPAGCAAIKLQNSMWHTLSLQFSSDSSQKSALRFKMFLSYYCYYPCLTMILQCLLTSGPPIYFTVRVISRTGYMQEWWSEGNESLAYSTMLPSAASTFFVHSCPITLSPPGSGNPLIVKAPRFLFLALKECSTGSSALPWTPWHASDSLLLGNETWPWRFVSKIATSVTNKMLTSPLFPLFGQKRLFTTDPLNCKTYPLC